MTSERLFAELLHRLGRYTEAMVLYAVIQQRADEFEFKTTASRISADILQGAVDKKNVQRSLAALEARGLVDLRTHPNHRTHITLNQEAVLTLLREPTSCDLPGLREETFPFLSACADAVQAETTN